VTKINCLPQGWVSAFYGDVYLSASNGTGGKQNKDGIGIPVSRIETIASENIDYHRIGYLADYDQEKVEKHLLEDGDILFSHINSPIHLGKTALYDGKQILYHGINLLRIVVDRNVILPKLFNYHCNYTRALGYFSQNAQHAVNQSSLNQKKLSSFELFLPPLVEQKVIADKLDSLLAQVEMTKARLDRIPDILKRFRQSVLAAAVSGRLTEEWRKQNSTIGHSFEEIHSEKQKLIELKSVKKDLVAQKAEPIFTVPKSWLFLRLKSLAIKITDGEHKTPKRESSGRYLLSARNVRDGYISTENVDYVGEEEFTKLRKRCDPDKGDVLISCSGSVGRISLVDQDDKYVMVRSAALIRVANKYIDSKFLMYVLQSPMLQKNIEESSKSTAQSNLFLGPIKELSVPLPSCEEQTEIVRRVEELFAFADAVEQKAQAATERVNKLTQSILAKAFRGELTADWRAANPDLISGENSAEALLEKIKSEREALKPKKKTRAKKVKG